MCFTQDELNFEQPDNSPFVVILDDSENFTATFFTTLQLAEAYNTEAPIESRIYCGLSVNYDLYN